MKPGWGANGVVQKNGLTTTVAMKTSWSAASHRFSRLFKIAVHPAELFVFCLAIARYRMTRYPKVKRIVSRRQCDAWVTFAAIARGSRFRSTLHEMNSQVVDYGAECFGCNLHRKCIPEFMILDQLNHLPCLFFRSGIPCIYLAYFDWHFFIILNDCNNNIA